MIGPMNASNQEFGSSNWNPVEALSRRLGNRNAKKQNAIGNAMATQQQHEHELKKMVTEHVLGETAKSSEHSRNMEFFSHVKKHAQAGTGINVSVGGNTASYTKKMSKPKATAPTSEATPLQPKSTFVGMPNKPVIKRNETASETPASSSAPRPVVTRDPKTGRAVSLKEKIVAKPVKKLTSAKSGPSVTRDPKTGKIKSLKQKG